MTTEDSTLREVDQELAEERQFEMIRKYAPTLVIFAILCIIGVAANQYFSHQKSTKAEAAALAYQEALTALSEDERLGQERLAKIEENGPDGYGVLAAFRRAAIFAAEGDTPRAYTQYRSIVGRKNAPQHIRDLARLRSAYLSLDAGGLEVVKTDLGDLPARKTPLAFYAREAIALGQLSDKDYDGAIAEFDFLANGAGVPARLKLRASDFLVVAQAGKSGANITGEARVDDLLNRVGDLPDVPITVDESVIIEEGGVAHDHDGDGVSDHVEHPPIAQQDSLIEGAPINEAVQQGSDKLKEAGSEAVATGREAADKAAEKLVDETNKKVDDIPVP